MRLNASRNESNLEHNSIGQKWKKLNDLFWLWTDSCCSPDWASTLPFTHLISSSWQYAQAGQFCFILIAYFRLKKLVFFDYFDVEMGAWEQFTFIRCCAPLPSLFCANSRIPIYILAVELNYCKHLCGPARHNRLAWSCIMLVPPTGCFGKFTIFHFWHVWASGAGRSRGISSSIVFHNVGIFTRWTLFDSGSHTSVWAHSRNPLHLDNSSVLWRCVSFLKKKVKITF